MKYLIEQSQKLSRNLLVMNVSSKGTTTVNLGIVEVVNLRRTQDVSVFGIRREGEW